MKRLTVLLMVAFCTLNLSSQVTTNDKNIFNHLDFGVTVGSLGLGFDLSMPIGNYVDLRAGATFVPTITKESYFGAKVGKDDPTKTNEENQSIQNQRLQKLTNLMYNFTGYEIKNKIAMEMTPTFHQFKLLVDVHPFKEHRNWHVTMGFFVGNHRIGKAVNSREDMVTLMAVNMYNNIYWKTFYEQDFIKYEDMGGQLPPKAAKKILSYGDIGYRIGTFKHDFYATQDMYYDHDVYAKALYDDEGNLIQAAQFVEDEDDPDFGNYVLLHRKGDIQYHKGDLMYKAGDEYLMKPDDNITVSANAFVNAFRPYIGVGYSGPITKDKRTSISCDLGVLIWGGRPKMITHDGVDMLRDLENINGQVNRNLNLFRHLPAYPVLDLRISHRIF